jgi:hypothetical protein
VSGGGEKACVEKTVRRQVQAGAGGTERFRDRRDDAKFRLGPLITVTGGNFAKGTMVPFSHWHFSVNAVQYLLF